MTALYRSPSNGSSPLARGLRQPDPQQEQGSGIIPARAGFTLQSGRGRRIQGDHPRSRGVYGAHEQGCGAVGGSSPLARGLRIAEAVRLTLTGIIPARAGFTGLEALSIRGKLDHPRSRGVYECAHGNGFSSKGSSPLARGLPIAPFHVYRPGGITPARAGFTRPMPSRTASAWDHPRSRGVYRNPASTAARTLGSSPLARGLLCG